MDDCVLYREVSSQRDSSLLQRDLDLLYNWEKTWQMELNPSKCAVLSFSTSRNYPTYDYYIHNEVLTRVNEHKYLGVILSDNFKWSSHISTSVNRARQKLGFIRRNTRGMSRSVKDTAYKTLVRPHLEYASAVWDPFTRQDIHKLEQVQRSAARLVTGDFRRSSSVTGMLEDLKWEPLFQRRMVSRLVMVYRKLQDDVAIPKELFFQFNPNQRTRSSTN